MSPRTHHSITNFSSIPLVITKGSVTWRRISVKTSPEIGLCHFRSLVHKSIAMQNNLWLRYLPATVGSRDGPWRRNTLVLPHSTKAAHSRWPSSLPRYFPSYPSSPAAQTHTRGHITVTDTKRSEVTPSTLLLTTSTHCGRSSVGMRLPHIPWGLCSGMLASRWWTSARKNV